MVIYFRIFLLLFLPLLALFFITEFSVHPFLQGHSAKKLVSNHKDLPKQVVLLVIDSLKYSYSSRFEVIVNTTKHFSDNTFLGKSRVGTPTMTTQRIQSLMTGSQIFSISNILRTFQASKVVTDNLLWQLTKSGKTSAVFGDNTWEKLFDFTHTAVCPNSFDIFDIDTCDQLIYQSLPKKILTNLKDTQNPSFIIAHFLGIDHVGHSTSSITHPKMQLKINQISAFLQNLFNQAQKSTLFIITGDHAMRPDGNHGGSSQQQTQTFVFAYYKGVQLYKQAKKAQFSQLSLTSTLSILLDVPLPLNSMGSPIINMLPRRMMTKANILQLNLNLYKNYQKMLQFYGQQISQTQSTNYLSQLQNQNLQQSQELILQQVASKLNFLRFATPNRTQIITVAIMISLLVLIFVLFTFSDQLLSLFYFPSFRALMNVLCTGFSLFTLFSSYLSWHYTKHLSNSLIVGLFLAVLIGVSLKKPKSKDFLGGILILVSIVLLQQTEHDNSNEFRASFLRTDWINALFSSRQFCLILISVYTFFCLKYINTSGNEQANNINKQKTTSYHLLYYIITLLVVLSYINFIAFHILETPFYFLPKLITFITIIFLIRLPRLRQYSFNKKMLIFQFLIINMLALLIGKHFPLILSVCLLTERLSKDYCSYQIIMSLLAKCVWWWPLGNRYEYSGVDILRTYVFSQNYSTALNGFCLVIYINCPFLLNLLLINTRFLEYTLIGKKMDQRKQTIQNLPLQDEEKPIIEQNTQRNGKYQNESLNKESTDKVRNKLMKSNFKFVSVLLIGLVGSIWATIANNQQLLLTIVCAPLLVLITIITFSSLAIVLLLTFV